jgi:hypothetical protein
MAAMPSLDHEALLELLRACPELAAHLVRDVAGAQVPEGARVVTREADFTEIFPAEFRVDLVFEIGDPPIAGILFEHQRSRDESKQFVWPAYTALLHAKLRRPVYLVVAAFDPAVARWAARTIETFQPGSAFAPIVIGRKAIPRIRDLREAEQWPELAVLSALAHGNTRGGFEVARTAAEAAAGLDPARGTLCYELILGVLNEGARRALEAYMQENKQQFFSETARRHYDRGRREGHLETARTALRQLIEARLEGIPDEIGARIEACEDVEVLLDWHKRVGKAADAAAVEAVFA